MRQRWLRRLLITIVVIILIFVAANGALHIWLRRHPTPSRWDFFAQRPAAYQQSVYWSPAFVLEQQRLGNYTNFQGRWYTIEYGLRHTVGQPKTPVHSVYMFGNSTIYGTEVPDEYTIPSQLQALYNTQSQPYRIVNMGDPGASAFHQVEILKTLDLKLGDLVVFYDGVVDAGSLYTTARSRRRLTFPLNLCGWQDDHAMGLDLFALLCDGIEASPPSDITDPVQLQVAITQLAMSYRNDLLMANRFTRLAGARFYHFMQPHMWTKPLSTYEQQIASRPYLVPAALEMVMITSYPALVHAAQNLPQGESFDLTHNLDSARTAGEEMYLDCCHFTERGNEIIAGAIFERLHTF